MWHNTTYMTCIFKKADYKSLLKYAAVGIATGLANGLFGSGGGMIAVPAMVLLLGLDEHIAHATAIAVILPLTLVSALLYISGSYLDWGVTWKTIIGGAAGGYAGAKLLKVLPENILRKVFGLFIIAGAVRMIVG
jgi:uncharacterized membrane protein YfcA